MMRTIKVDIPGLNLILGGGIPLLGRLDKLFRESATLLLRGPPGSGKTVFGTQLAGSLARQLNGDVAYGCVEILPSELDAQHAGIRRPEVKERVVQVGLKQQGLRSEECRIFAGVLDLGSAGEESSRLAEEALKLRDNVEKRSGKPYVLVIDSLSDGYNLGASASRRLADDLCKMAAKHGLVLILLEEIVDSRPSAWSFAADMVIELDRSSDQASNDSDAFERVLKIIKNRHGPAEPGTHRFTIFPNYGILTLPRPRTYLAQWASKFIPQPKSIQSSQGQVWTDIKHADIKRKFHKSVIAVYGPKEDHVADFAKRLGTLTLSREGEFKEVEDRDMILDFSRFIPAQLVHALAKSPTKHITIDCGDPFLGGDWLLHAAIGKLKEIESDGKPLRRVVIGDLQVTRMFSNPNGIRRALAILSSLLRHAEIPVVLFETACGQTPPIADFADVIIEIPDPKIDDSGPYVRERPLDWSGAAAR